MSGPQGKSVGEGACDPGGRRGWKRAEREIRATLGTLATCERDLGAAGLGVSGSGQRLPGASCQPSDGDFAMLRG